MKVLCRSLIPIKKPKIQLEGTVVYNSRWPQCLIHQSRPSCCGRRSLMFRFISKRNKSRFITLPTASLFPPSVATCLFTWQYRRSRIEPACWRTGSTTAQHQVLLGCAPHNSKGLQLGSFTSVVLNKYSAKLQWEQQCLMSCIHLNNKDVLEWHKRWFHKRINNCVRANFISLCNKWLTSSQQRVPLSFLIAHDDSTWRGNGTHASSQETGKLTGWGILQEHAGQGILSVHKE